MSALLQNWFMQKNSQLLLKDQNFSEFRRFLEILLVILTEKQGRKSNLEKTQGDWSACT